MRNLKYLALGALLIIWGLPLQAAQLEGLYDAEVAVADQGRASRAEAMGTAMTDVLLKVGGNASVLEAEAIKKAVDNASRYVRQYRYLSEGGPAQGAGSSENSLMLQVGFDSASIDKLLRGAGFNVWGASRPATLAWLVVDDGGRRTLVGANDQGLVRKVLGSEAQRRAIPLRLPLLDLTDQSRVRAIDVWGGFWENIKEASRRYESQAILVGKLYKSGKLWEARWTLLYQGERHEWQHSSSGVSAAIASGVGGSADYLSSYFASTGYTGKEQLALRIRAVSGMAGYRRVNDYLRSLHGVKAVRLHRVDNNSASFLMEIEGGRGAVLQAIQMGDVLAEVEPPLEEYAPGAVDQPLSDATPYGARPDTTSGSLGQPATIEPVDNASQSDMESEESAGDTGMLLQQPSSPPIEELFFRLLP